MKKIVFLLCSLLVVSVLLTACGGDEPVVGTVTPSGEEAAVGGEVAPGGEEAAVGEEATPGDEEAAVGEEVTPNDGEAESEEVSELADAPLAIGRVEGGTYTNEYLGIAATLNENWAFYTAEELQELPGLAAEEFEGTELGELAKDVDQFTDMQAENVNDLTVLNIGYQRLDMVSRLAYAQMTEEEIIETTLAQKDMIIEAYAQSGIVTESIEKKTVQFLGEERCALYTVASIEGTPYYILQIYAFNNGEWGVTMTFGSYVEDRTESLLELFYKI